MAVEEVDADALDAEKYGNTAGDIKGTVSLAEGVGQMVVI